jgi:predicted PurR-regulated permease PerM
MGFVPIVGWLVGTLVALTVALAQFGLVPLVLAKVLAVMVAGTAIETAVLSPKLVGARVGLHPVWLIFALFAFSYLLGLLGALIAVPLAAATGVLMRHALGLYLKSEVYRGAAPAKPGPPP